MIRQFVIGFMILLSSAIFAGGAPEVNFIADLEASLLKGDFTETEALAIAAAAKQYDWSAVRRVRPELIVDILESLKDVDTEVVAEKFGAIAFEVGAAAATLLNKGYSES